MEAKVSAKRSAALERFLAALRKAGLK